MTTTIAITIAGTEVAFGLPDADAGRILAAFTQMWTTTDAEGAPVVPDTVTVVRQIAQSVVEGLAAQAIRIEQDAAAQVARAAVAPIDVSIV
jgi:hypothetical protein